MAAVLGVTAYGAYATRPGAAAAPHAELPEPPAGGASTSSWYYRKTPQEIQDLLGPDNRLVSIQVAQPSPLLLDVAMVRNTGDNHRTWWWLPGPGLECTGAQLGSFAASHNARVVSLAPYVVRGTTYFAALYLGSTGGADDTGWWWYFDIPASGIEPLLTEHKARLVDLRSYSKGGTAYALLMVPKASPEDTSWWYTGLDAATTRANLDTHKSVLTSLQQAAAGGLDVVMASSPHPTMPGYQNVSWVWQTNDTD